MPEGTARRIRGIAIGPAGYLRNSNSAGNADLVFPYGDPATDVPVVGDWDGDAEGVDTIGIYRSNVFYLRNTNTPGNADVTAGFGAPGDIPVVGDWDGDGDDTIGVYRPSTGWWYLRNSNTPGNPDLAFTFGPLNQAPVTGDWDGNGTDTIGIYSGNVFYRRNTNTAGNAELTAGFGAAGDRPVTGDWDGNGTDTIGVYRPGTGAWFLRNSNTGGAADLSFSYGLANETPVVGDWDGMGGVLSWAKDYVVRDGLPLASIEPVGGTAVTTHFHLDHLGSVRRLTNASGTVVASRDYLPFGSFISNTSSERLAFTAHARDLRSAGNLDDLDYMHARYYNPTLGRFLSPDPLRGSLRRPQSFNLYGYVLGNPTNLVDPFGLEPPPSGITVTAPDPSREEDERRRAESLRRVALELALASLNQSLGVQAGTMTYRGLEQLSTSSAGSWINSEFTVPGPWGSAEAAHTSEWYDPATWNDIGAGLDGGWETAFQASYGVAGAAALGAGGLIAAEALGAPAVQAFAHGGRTWHLGLELAGERSLIHLGNAGRVGRGIHLALGYVGPRAANLHIYVQRTFPFVRLWWPASDRRRLGECTFG